MSSGGHEYKFPETAAEDDGRAMLPLASGIDVQIRFEGRSQIGLQPVAAGGGEVWNSGKNGVLSFAGAGDEFWILLWDGKTVELPGGGGALGLRGSSVVPTRALKRFLAALEPPGAAAASATTHRISRRSS
ncbi:MAG: hypothetical protein GY953_05695, partial [bacterium]|nr:hypothetical protein [bacterium]